MAKGQDAKKSIKKVGKSLKEKRKDKNTKKAAATMESREL